MAKRGGRKGNVGKALSASVTRGLLRAMISINPPPGRRVSWLDPDLEAPPPLDS